MSETYSTDAVVIGAGVGGACAALSLAQRGAQVTLLEAGELPRHKVCGEFLSPESRASFKRLGIEGEIFAAGALSVHAARIKARTREIEVPLPPGGLALSRYRLDAILWHAARERGIRCQARTRVRHTEHNPDGSFSVHAADDLITAPAVVAASGRAPGWLDHHETQAPATRYLGLKAHFRGVRLEPGVVELYPWRGGYCGLVRVEEGLTDVCLLVNYDIVQEREQRAPAEFWQWLLSQQPALAKTFAEAEIATPWLATANVAFGRQEPVGDGILRIGDAAGYIHPFAGDGMSMAARSGELAGAIIGAQLRGGISANDACTLYEAAWRREFASRLSWATRLQPLLTSPLLTQLAAPIFAGVPALARFAVSRTRGA